MVTNDTRQELCYLLALSEVQGTMSFLALATAARKTAVERFTASWLSRSPRSPKQIIDHMMEFNSIELRAPGNYKITPRGFNRLRELKERSRSD